jgi:hypothetical protein
LGTNDNINYKLPVPFYKNQYLIGKKIIKMKTGGDHTCSIVSDSKLYCCGYASGISFNWITGWTCGSQVGNGYFSGSVASPTPIVGTNYNVTDFSLSFRTTCFIINGIVYCMGDNG